MKWGLMAGAAALILSLAVGIASGASLAAAFVRAAIFGGVFFGLGFGAYKLINNFIPELLFQDGGGGGVEPVDFSGPFPGARVNITLGDTSGAALPNPHDDLENSDEVGNIADLVSGAVKSAKKKAPVNLPPLGIDQKPWEGYTEEGGGTVDSQPFGGGGLDSDNAAGNAGGNTAGIAGDFAGAEAGGSSAADFGQAAASGGLNSGLAGLPDLDGMTGSFADDVAGAEMPADEPLDVSTFERKSSGGGKPPKGFDNDFNPKEIAAGLRTVLNKDK